MATKLTTISIDTKGGVVLSVDRSILTADSVVFRRLIDDLSQTQIEMRDFTSDTVELFLKHLKNKAVDVIQKSHFRELHKLSMVFGVGWLTEHSRSWLEEIIIRAFRDQPDYPSQEFVFEESCYIFKKWADSDVIAYLITAVRFTDSSEHFIKQFMKNIAVIDKEQLQFLLFLAGSNAKVILEAIICHLKNSRQKSLDENTWFLVLNINLILCFKRWPDLTYKMFSILTELEDVDDVRKLFKLMTESSQAAFSGCSRTNYSKENSAVLFDSLEWNKLYSKCNTLEDILTSYVREGGKVNLYVVVDLLGKVTYFHPPSREQSEKFVKTLVCCYQDMPTRKISRQYINQVISALKFSAKDTKCQIIHLLKLIRDNLSLASDFHNIRIEGVELNGRESEGQTVEQYTFDNITEESSSLIKKVLNTFRKHPTGQSQRASTEEKHSSNDLYIKIEFDHPVFNNCSPEDKESSRGIILKHSMGGLDHTLELCIDDSYYQANGLLFETQSLEVEDIHWYMETSVETKEGMRVTVPLCRSGWWWRMWLLQSGHGWRLDKMCVVECEIGRYLVAK